MSLLYSTKLFLLQRYSTMPSSIFSAFNAEELKVANPHTTFTLTFTSSTPLRSPPRALSHPYNPSQVAASVATFKPLAKGQTLYSMGDTPSDFWVVAHGEVVRDYRDGSAPQTLKVGSYFGEVRLVALVLQYVYLYTWCMSIKHRSVKGRQAHVRTHESLLTLMRAQFNQGTISIT